MTRRTRRWFFLFSAVLLASLFALGYSRLPPAGATPSPYGDAVNALIVPTRHVTDAITAVNFDIRGFDTLGEEFILFASVMGVVLLMRRQNDEPTGDHEDKLPGRTVPPPSAVLRLTALLLLPATVLFGIYVVTHGQLTPGGGFQGGVILSTAPLLLYLAGSFTQFRRTTPVRILAVSEAFGATVYILVGGLSVLLGGLFLENLLPLGKTGSIISGGTIAFIDIGVGLEVSGGFVLALLAYLEELMEDKAE